jgi:acyl dehydratase
MLNERVFDGKEQFGKYFEDFQEGDVYKHWPGRTITESDNVLFCMLTMNHMPLHIDKEYAKKSQHSRILVVGTLPFALAVGMSVRDTSGKTIANLEYEKIEHLAPVFIGDTLYAETTVLDKRLSETKPDRGIIHVETKAYNQDGKPILSFKRRFLAPSRLGRTGKV